MPAIVAWLIAGASWALASGLGRFLTAMGLSMVIAEFVTDEWVGQVQSQWGGLPGFVLSMLGFFGADKMVTIIFSAYAVKAGAGAIRGFARRAGAIAGGA